MPFCLAMPAPVLVLMVSSRSGNPRGSSEMLHYYGFIGSPGIRGTNIAGLLNPNLINSLFLNLGSAYIQIQEERNWRRESCHLLVQSRNMAELAWAGLRLKPVTSSSLGITSMGSWNPMT